MTKSHKIDGKEIVSQYRIYLNERVIKTLFQKMWFKGSFVEKLLFSGTSDQVKRETCDGKSYKGIRQRIVPKELGSTSAPNLTWERKSVAGERHRKGIREDKCVSREMKGPPPF